MPKYADPSVYPVGTPAATDNVMTRTAAGADGNFALGNLAGIAGAAVATDQSVYLGSGGWASYSLTAAGRALSGVAGTANTFPYFSAANVVTLGSVTSTGLSVLGAASQAAARTAIQAVGSVGNETVGGTKTYTATVQIQNTGPGFWLDETDGTAGALISLDSGRVQLQNRGSNFGPFVSRLLNIAMDGSDTGIGGTVNPLTDNSQSLGSSGRRWTAVWAVNASIQTSDARLKTEPRHLKDAEFKAFSAVCRLPPVWRWLSRVHGDESCEPEGQAARKHFGPTVQAAMQVFKDHGLEAFENAPFCYDEWEAEPATYDEEGNELTPAREAGDRYSFRKEELLCGMVSALAREIDDVKAENSELRGQLTELAARLAALEAKA